MALIECDECKEKISEKATVCPRCGYPISNSSKISNKIRHIKKKKPIIIIASVIVLILLFLVIYQSTNSIDKSEYYNSFKWGTTYSELKEILGEQATANDSKTTMLMKYKDFQGQKNTKATAYYQCVDDSLVKIGIMVMNGDNSKYSNDELLKNLIKQYEKLYGKHEKMDITYTWKTDDTIINLYAIDSDTILIDYDPL